MAGKDDTGIISARTIDGQTALIKTSYKKREELHEQLVKKKVTSDKDYYKQTEQLEKDFRRRAEEIALKAEENKIKRMTARQRFEHNKRIAEEAAITIASKEEELKRLDDLHKAYNKRVSQLERERESETAKQRASLTAAERKESQKRLVAIEDEIDRIRGEQVQVSHDTTKAQKQLDDTRAALDDYEKTKSVFETRQERTAAEVAEQQDRVDKARLKKLSLEQDHQDKIKKLQDKLREAISSGNKLAIAGVKEEIKAEEEKFKKGEEYKEAERALAEENHELVKKQNKASLDMTKSLKNAASAALSNAMSAMTNAVDSTMNTMYGSQGRMNARLQGLTDDFEDHVSKVSKNIGLSGVVSQKAVVAKMTELIDSGVAYNVELRAFLAETSQNIASTFNALDQTLLRIVRIQQADSTAARLAMESSLTTLFNKTFKDTSYLSDVYDSVTSAIVDATSQMTRDQSLEFEYTLQKWLGSLYSVGMSSEGISTIAQGINYLATGNVSALSGNDSLQTLLAMSASRTKKSYADLLTGNMTGDDTNDLLRAMVEYLAQIATSQENFVTKSAYADLFGMSITDLSSFATLSTDTINNIYKQNQTYTTLMEKELNDQFSSMLGRLNSSQIIDTLIDNSMTSAATKIGSTAVTYGLWKVLNIVESLTGGIDLPFVNIFGYGIDLNTTVTQLAKTGMVGLGLMGSLLEGLTSGSAFGTYDLNKWGYEEYNQRGQLLPGIASGFTSGTSMSASMGVGSSSGDDVKETSMQDASDEAMESSGVTSEEMKSGEEVQNRMLDTLLSIEQLLDPKRVFYTGIAGVVASNSISEITSKENDTYTNLATSSYITSKTLESTAANTDEKISNLIDAVKDDASETVNLESIISEAVKIALGNFITETQNYPLAVTPKNWV